MQFSKFDGFASVKDLVTEAKNNKMSAVGLTDHGTMAGAIVFLKECRKQGIKPIIGMEGYLAADHTCHSKDCQPNKRRGNRHINIIAKNYTGYKNLCQLSQIASLEGMYFDPRVDFELLQKYSEGLIVTSACLSNIINWKLSIDKYDEALEISDGFKQIFGEDFYLEIMYHGLNLEGKILQDIQKIGSELSIKVIATNDVHYITREQAEFQKVVMCMNSKRTLKDPKRINFPYDEFYFKSSLEMYKLFGHVPSAMNNTLEIAEKCDYSDIVFIEEGGPMRLPEFDLPKGFSSPYKFLVHLANKGIKEQGLSNSPKHVERLNQELSDIKLIWDTKRYDFATYFLIVEDIMRHARKKKIMAGIRGSGYGSLLVRVLGISEGVDILDQELLWERFLGFDNSYFLCEGDFGITD